MTRYEILDKLPGIGEERPYFCKSYIHKTIQTEEMLTDVISSHSKEKDKDEYNSTYRNPLWSERWIYLRKFFKAQ